jgi:hypothetical protein
MNSGKESSRSTANHHADGNPRSLLERREGLGDSQTDLVQKCSFFGAYSTEMIPGDVGRAPTIQRTGGRSAYNVVEDAS